MDGTESLPAWLASYLCTSCCVRMLTSRVSQYWSASSTFRLRWAFTLGVLSARRLQQPCAVLAALGGYMVNQYAPRARCCLLQMPRRCTTDGSSGHFSEPGGPMQGQGSTLMGKSLQLSVRYHGELSHW